MDRAVEWYLAITALVIGASHVLRPGDWCEAFRQLHRCGRPGAFVNGGLSLFAGAIIVAGHGSWSWPGTIVAVFGWLQIVKGSYCFLLPEFSPSLDGIGLALAAWLRRGGRNVFGAQRLDLVWPLDCVNQAGHWSVRLQLSNFPDSRIDSEHD